MRCLRSSSPDRLRPQQVPSRSGAEGGEGANPAPDLRAPAGFPDGRRRPSTAPGAPSSETSGTVPGCVPPLSGCGSGAPRLPEFTRWPREVTRSSSALAGGVARNLQATCPGILNPYIALAGRLQGMDRAPASRRRAVLRRPGRATRDVSRDRTHEAEQMARHPGRSQPLPVRAKPVSAHSPGRRPPLRRERSPPPRGPEREPPGRLLDLPGGRPPRRRFAIPRTCPFGARRRARMKESIAEAEPPFRDRRPAIRRLVELWSAAAYDPGVDARVWAGSYPGPPLLSISIRLDCFQNVPHASGCAAFSPPPGLALPPIAPEGQGQCGGGRVPPERSPFASHPPSGAHFRS